jgi:protein-tyrosine phosphatase
LRSDRERRSRPDRIPDDADLQIFRVSIHHEITELGRLRLLWLLRREAGLASFERLIRDYYHVIALERTAQINRIITTISDTRNLPALIHCVGGRDRTGLVAALIQLHVGVSRQTVLEDYLATNRAYEPLINKYIGYVRWISLSRLNPARIRRVLEARGEYLDEALDKILAAYGTIGDYLRDACHIDQRSLLALRESLLE